MTIVEHSANPFKKELRSGEPRLLYWVTSPWTGMIEIIGNSGAHGVIIDLEHSSTTLRELEHMLLAARASGLRALVRPVSIDARDVSRILDAGADGIAFPLISGGGLAAQARRCIEYPPGGDRGWGGPHIRRTAWTGATVASRGEEALSPDSIYTDAFIQWAEDIVSIFLVESPEGVDALEEIIDVGRPDVVCFGMGDYSVAVRFSREACRKAAERVYDVCRAAGIGVSITPGVSGRIGEFYPGCFFLGGVDTLICSDAIRREVERSRSFMPS